MNSLDCWMQLPTPCLLCLRNAFPQEADGNSQPSMCGSQLCLSRGHCFCGDSRLRSPSPTGRWGCQHPFPVPSKFKSQFPCLIEIPCKSVCLSMFFLFFPHSIIFHRPLQSLHSALGNRSRHLSGAAQKLHLAANQFGQEPCLSVLSI